MGHVGQLVPKDLKELVETTVNVVCQEQKVTKVLAGRPAVQVWMASEGLLVIKVTKVIKGCKDNVVLKGSVDPKVPLVRRV